MMDESAKKGAGRAGAVFSTLAALLAAAHFIFLMKYFQPAYSTMDAHGYHEQAKLLAAAGKTYFIPENEIQYIGYTWKESPGGRYYTLWPPGFPVVLSVVYRAAGPAASLYVNPVLAALAVLLVFLLGRAWLGPGWGLAAAALAAMNPALDEHALYGYSHVTVMFLLLCGLWCAARRAKGGGAGWAFAAGLLLGAIPSVRITESILIPAVFLFVLLAGGGKGRGLRGAAAFSLGAAVPLAVFMVYNQVNFGAPWNTGYSAFFGYRASSVFRWDFFRANAAGHLKMLMSEGGGPVFALGVAGIACALTRRDSWKEGALLAGLALPLMLVYMFQGSGVNMRFFVPILPLFALGTAYLLKGMAGERRGAAAALAAVALVLSAGWGLPQAAARMNELYQKNKVLARAEKMLEERAPAGAVVIADEALCQYLDYFGGWKLVSTSGENRRRFQIQGNLTLHGFMNELSGLVWDWAGEGGGVYWIMPERVGEVAQRRMPPGQRLERAAGFRLPRGSGGEVSRLKRPPGEIRPEMRMDTAFEALLSQPDITLYEWKKGKDREPGTGKMKTSDHEVTTEKEDDNEKHHGILFG